MPRFEPFVALRYAAADRLADLVAPPYDVLSPTQVRAYATRDRHNIVHVDVPQVMATDAVEPYAAAALLLRSWVSAGVLVADDRPSLTIHRMRFQDATGTERETVGVLGGLEVVPAGGGGVLPHERTTPKDSTDRLDLSIATGTNLSPVWGLSLASGLTEELAAPGQLVGQVSLDGVDHVLERVDDPDRLARISAIVADDDVLIADGHHRYGVARQLAERAAGDRAAVVVGPGGFRPPTLAPGAADLTLAYVQELEADQLAISPIHRLYAGASAADITEALACDFELTEVGGGLTDVGGGLTDVGGAPETTAEALLAYGEPILVTTQGAFRMQPKPGAFDEVRALDGAWLEHSLADVPVTVRYQHSAAAALAAVGSHSEGTSAAVLIRPPALAEIVRTAREGLLMPPKSTFFTPKLPTGFVIRDLSA